jgi:molybdate transport system substrate-binding protein
MGCSSDKDQINITISAASSMMDSLYEIKQQFELEHPEVTVYFNFGGSGSLRRQIEQGAPIDIFISASEKEYTRLLDEELVTAGEVILKNKLVVISPKNSENKSLDDFLKSTEKLAIGTPGAVPAGTYAKEAFENMNIWDEFEERKVFAKDARHVLTLVSEGTVGAGIVYGSDVKKSNEIAILEELNPMYHRPIRYFMALVEKDSIEEQKKVFAIKQFYDYLQTETSLAIFKDYGFEVVQQEKLVNE